MVPLFWDSNLGRMLFAGLTSDKSRNRKLTPSFGRVADTARRFLLLRGAGLFQNRLFAGGRRGNGHGGFGGCAWRRGGDRGSAFRVRLLQESCRGLLGAAGIVVGLFGFTVLVDGALTLPQHVKNLSQVDVAPDFRPLFRRLRNGLQGFAERVGRRLVVFLVEERFAHAEIRQRPVRLNRKRALVLRHRIIKPTLLGDILSPPNGRAGTQRSASLQDQVVGVDLNSTRFRPAETGW